MLKTLQHRAEAYFQRFVKGNQLCNVFCACFTANLAPPELERLQWKVVLDRIDYGLHACLIQRIVPAKSSSVALVLLVSTVLRGQQASSRRSESNGCESMACAQDYFEGRNTRLTNKPTACHHWGSKTQTDTIRWRRQHSPKLQCMQCLLSLQGIHEYSSTLWADVITTQIKLLESV